MNFKLTIAAATAIILAACGKPKVDETNATAAEVAEAVADAGGSDLHLTAGRWESTLEFTEVNAPGMPPEMASVMKGMIGEAQNYATCLSKEEAEKPDADFFSGEDKDCTHEHFKMGGGRIDAKMVCKSDDGGRVTNAMAGTYSPRAYDMVMESHAEGGEQAGMAMKMKIKSAYVGACKGHEDA